MLLRSRTLSSCVLSSGLFFNEFSFSQDRIFDGCRFALRAPFLLPNAEHQHQAFNDPNLFNNYRDFVWHLHSPCWTVNLGTHLSSTTLFSVTVNLDENSEQNPCQSMCDVLLTLSTPNKWVYYLPALPKMGTTVSFSRLYREELTLKVSSGESFQVDATEVQIEETEGASSGLRDLCPKEGSL